MVIADPGSSVLIMYDSNGTVMVHKHTRHYTGYSMGGIHKGRPTARCHTCAERCHGTARASRPSDPRAKELSNAPGKPGSSRGSPKSTPSVHWSAAV